MEKRLVTVPFDDFEGEGASVTYWVNPPSGRIRMISTLQKRVSIQQLRQRGKGKAQTPEELVALLDASSEQLDADDLIWKVLVGADGKAALIDSWTLRGWGDDDTFPGPGIQSVSLEGLDALEGRERQQVLSRLIDAINDAGKLPSQNGTTSLSSEPDETVPPKRVSLATALAAE